MQQIMTDALAGEDEAWSHLLSVELPEIEGSDRLVEHVDRYVRLYLQAFAPLKACHVRLAPATYGLNAEGMSTEALDAVRADLASRLFGEDEAWRVSLEMRPGAGQTEYELPVKAAVPEPVSAEAAEDTDIAVEMTHFREDMRAIADSLTGHEALRESVETFRAELGELTEAFSERVSHAAHAIENAAQRVEASAALIPDPDRFELVLTRNEASAAILERGVRQSLNLLLQAVETMAERGALPQRERLTRDRATAGSDAAA